MARSRSLELEQYEDRTVPAVYGIPWHDANHLTLSFAPPGTAIAAHQSNLFETLDAQLPRDVWQREILRAFQTWAVQGNINFRVVPDDGQPFGVSGLTQGDPRFGDIRIGAQSMALDLLSVSVPHDSVLSGTLSGDVFLNSDPSLTWDAAHLFSVMLHEAGHVLGLDDSTDPLSPMFPHYSGRTVLTPADIHAIQGLYGVRSPDFNEGNNGNDSFDRATQLHFPGGQGSYNGATPVVAYGDITTVPDVDFFALRPYSNYRGPMTFRLLTAGVSLLAPQLMVYDTNHNLLGQATSTTVGGDELMVRLSQVDPNVTYFIKVSGATADVFGVGRYGLAVTFDANLLPSVTAPQIDAVLRGPYETLQVNDIDQLFRNPPATYFNDDHHTNDTLNQASTLSTTAGYAASTHYEMLASLSDATDIDNYRVRSPNVAQGAPNVMTVTLTAADLNGVDGQVSVFDSQFHPVVVQVLVNGNHTYTIQLPQAGSSVDYLLQVAAASADNKVGNYRLSVDFGQVPADVQTFASSRLASAQNQETHTLYVAQTQLFQFALSADAQGIPTDAQVHMTIVDGAGHTVFDLVAKAGETVSGNSVFLAPGAYTVQFTAESPSGAVAPPLFFRLRGSSLSDPIGTGLADVTLNPIYTSPDDPGLYTYPGNITSPTPFLFF
jgi:hypothetical protein